MLARVILNVRQCRHLLFKQFHRNLGVTAVLSQKAATQLDPIQQLFVEKVREYTQKSKAAGGGLVEATAEDQKALEDDLEKITRAYGADSTDFTKFPTLSFADPELEPVGVKYEPKEDIEAEDMSEVGTEKEEKPYWVP